MNKNQLGSSDLYVTEIGFGCMSLGTDEQPAVRIIHEAIHQGVNFFDTADLYDYGINEEIVGKALKGRRQEVILATKAGNRWREDRSGWYWDPSKNYIKEAIKASLRRLQTDYIDLYQLHGGTIDDAIDETIEAFEELKQEGLIRHYGISSIRPNVIREYVKRSGIVSVMMQYSILDRRPEEEILSLLHENRVSVIARGPVARGYLSDRTLKSGAADYLDYSSNEILELVKKLRGLAGDDRSIAHVALRYPLAHPAVATVIPGASHLDQLIHNIQAADLPEITDDEIELIRSWSKANKYDLHR